VFSTEHSKSLGNYPVDVFFPFRVSNSFQLSLLIAPQLSNYIDLWLSNLVLYFIGVHKKYWSVDGVAQDHVQLLGLAIQFAGLLHEYIAIEVGAANLPWCATLDLSTSSDAKNL